MIFTVNNNMKPGRLAVVCSGHARDVHNSWLINSRLLAAHPSVLSSHFYSHVWTSCSDPRLHESTELDRHTLHSLQHRHVQLRQQDIMGDCLNKFQDADVFVPRDTAHDLQLFSRFMGQIMGFVMALDHWRNELASHDWIVRSRWDMMLDSRVIDTLSTDLHLCRSRTFYNKSLCMFNGQGSISGDVIYSDAGSWMELLPSTDVALDRIMHQCLRQREIFDRRYNRPFYLDGYWFNSHSLWHMLFQDQPFDVTALGESFRVATDSESLRVDYRANTSLLAQRHGQRIQKLKQQAEDQILQDQTGSGSPRLFKN